MDLDGGSDCPRYCIFPRLADVPPFSGRVLGGFIDSSSHSEPLSDTMVLFLLLQAIFKAETKNSRLGAERLVSFHSP